MDKPFIKLKTFEMEGDLEREKPSNIKSENLSFGCKTKSASRDMA